jgi:dihydrofolate reductase
VTRKLSVQQHVSLDGYILEEGTEFFRWWMALPDDPEAEAHLAVGLRRAGTHIMGRVTYEAMAAHWPAATGPIASVMNEIPKVVFSKSLPSADWPESRIAAGDTAEEIAHLKSEPGGDIVAHGGTRFVQSLVGLGVVDEYRLYAYPFAAGGGSHLFAALDGTQPLRLVTSAAFSSGVVELVYERRDLQ